MSEYSWYVKNCWIGVERDDQLLGVIMRSGQCRALGHFCFVEVSVCGKKYHASGQEDRIHPFHSIRLEEGDREPEYLLKAIGWCSDHETYAFRDAGGRVVKIVARAPDGVAEIHESIWPEAARAA
jgi:hypothetical protein